MPINYELSKVYKIYSHQGDKIYIGSTTKEFLSQRMASHRSNYKCWKSGKLHLCSSFELFDEYGIDNCLIELLEAKKCSNKDELHKLEGNYIRELVCVNKIIPGRTMTKWQEENKDIIKEKKKQYYEDNKDKLTERKI